MTHGYKGNGTTTLFAALNLLDAGGFLKRSLRRSDRVFGSFWTRRSFLGLPPTGGT